MTTGTTGSGSGRLGQIEAAWRLTLAAVAAEVLVWFLGAFVAPPTSLDELTEYAGRDAAIVRIAVGAGALAVLLVAWLVVAGRMRAGRGWARAVLTVVGVGFLVFRAGGSARWRGPRGGPPSTPCPTCWPRRRWSRCTFPGPAPTSSPGRRRPPEPRGRESRRW